jgi:predicted ATPase/transcriptional regulator with XRE-family HTH domain
VLCSQDLFGKKMDQSQPPFIFGEWVKKRRKTLDLTQEELAQRAGCSKFALRKIESGERRPSKQLAELLAGSLEISPEDKQTFIRVARGETNLERLHAPSLDSSFASSSDTSTRLGASLQPVPASNRIPLPPTPLLGRDSELAAMERLFINPQCRLLTLTGMGGIGKTRLAVEFATRQQTVFPGGVFYIPLAPIASAEDIVPAIADVFGFAFSGPFHPKEQLMNYIAVQMKQSSLLVLDNFEHLLDHSLSEEKQGAVGLICEFLQRMPNIKILATSREHLNLHGEWTYELHGLAVPPSEFSGRLEDYSAAALFLQSATRANADFEMTALEQQAVIQICQLLDGTPLAIELAAAWAGMLSCQEISQEIQANIDFLSTSMRDIPERHRSLRATFDHSWKLLSNEEREALCRLSVFNGEFDRNAAGKIAGATLPLLASLNSKSLLRRTKNGRYDLHEAIRQYALSHLDENPSDYIEICDLHARHFLQLVSGYEKDLRSANQQEAIREISDSLDNIRAAWKWAVKQKSFELIGRAVRSIGWYFELAGLHSEGIEQFELLIQSLKTVSRHGLLNRLLGLTTMQQGLLYFRKGQVHVAIEVYKDSVAILRPLGDPALLADALTFLGIILHLHGEYKESKALLQEALEYSQAIKDEWFEAYAIYNLGYIDSLMGDYQKGYEKMQTGLDMWREIGDLHYIALGLNFLVSTLINLGRYEEAKASMLESIALCEHAKNRWGMGTAYRYLGLATMADGQYDEAEHHFRKSIEIFRGYTGGWDIAISVAYLGEVRMMAGELAEAETTFQNALHLAIDVNAVPIALDSLLGLAQIYARVGKSEKALDLSSYILNHPSSTQEAKGRAEQLCANLTAKHKHLAMATVPQNLAKICLDEIVREVLGTS